MMITTLVPAMGSSNADALQLVVACSSLRALPRSLIDLSASEPSWQAYAIAVAAGKLSFE